MRPLAVLAGSFSLLKLTALHAQPATDEEMRQIVEWTEGIQKSENITPPPGTPPLAIASRETAAAAASALSLATIDYARRVKTGSATKADVVGADALIKASYVQYYDTVGRLAERYGDYETAGYAYASARQIAETAMAYLIAARREQDITRRAR